MTKRRRLLLSLMTWVCMVAFFLLIPSFFLWTFLLPILALTGGVAFACSYFFDPPTSRMLRLIRAKFSDREDTPEEVKEEIARLANVPRDFVEDILNELADKYEIEPGKFRATDDFDVEFEAERVVDPSGTLISRHLLGDVLFWEIDVLGDKEFERELHELMVTPSLTVAAFIRRLHAFKEAGKISIP